ncbi:MAG TPA: hypothetical protein VIA62_03860 [Thermoanaerobaculia bacterium]|jgi:hypothetical protein|nr:hypothetical protein [Thermoanaerobaculia bacterium]
MFRAIIAAVNTYKQAHPHIVKGLQVARKAKLGRLIKTTVKMIEERKKP